jgi:hypothetical protein
VGITVCWLPTTASQNPMFQGLDMTKSNPSQ